MAGHQAATRTMLNPGATARKKRLGAARQPRSAQAANGVAKRTHKRQITIDLIAGYARIHLAKSTLNWFSRPVQRTNLVAVRVTQVRQVVVPRWAITKAGGLLACGAAIRNTRRMKGITLLGRLHQKPNRAAIAMRSGFTINRRGYGKSARGTAVKIPVLVGSARTYAKRSQHSVVKLPRRFNIIYAKHYMTKHSCFLQLSGKFNQ